MRQRSQLHSFLGGLLRVSPKPDCILILSSLMLSSMFVLYGYDIEVISSYFSSVAWQMRLVPKICLPRPL